MKTDRSTFWHHGVISKVFCFGLFLLSVTSVLAAQAEGKPSPKGELTSQEIVERVSPSIVVILTGEGAGRLEALGSGVIVREKGVILTAYHLVKDAREVQVRLKSGEVFDRVTLLGFDERRDIAALQIQASGLTRIPIRDSEAGHVGEHVYVISNPKGLTWTVTDGMLSAMRLADDVAGAGTGYQLIQFSAPVSPGSSGGALVDSQGRCLGIVIASTGGQNLNFGIPIASVIGLADASGGTPLGQGNKLQLPAQQRPPSSEAVASTDPKERLRNAKTLHIRSRTNFFEPVQLENELRKRPEFEGLHLMLVADPRLADVEVVVDRPIFTYTFTFNIDDKKTSLVLATGKVTAFDGNLAAPMLAKEIINQFKAVRPEAVEKKEKK